VSGFLALKETTGKGPVAFLGEVQIA